MAETFTPKEVMEAAKGFEAKKAPESKEMAVAAPVRDESGGFIQLYPEYTGAEKHVNIDTFINTENLKEGTILSLEKPGHFSFDWEVTKGLPGVKQRSPEGTILMRRLMRDESLQKVYSGAKTEDMRKYLPKNTLEQLGISPLEG